MSGKFLTTCNLSFHILLAPIIDATLLVLFPDPESNFTLTEGSLGSLARGNGAVWWSWHLNAELLSVMRLRWGSVGGFQTHECQEDPVLNLSLHWAHPPPPTVFLCYLNRQALCVYVLIQINLNRALLSKLRIPDFPKLNQQGVYQVTFCSNQGVYKLYFEKLRPTVQRELTWIWWT